MGYFHLFHGVGDNLTQKYKTFFFSRFQFEINLVTYGDSKANAMNILHENWLILLPENGAIRAVYGPNWIGEILLIPLYCS